MITAEVQTLPMQAVLRRNPVMLVFCFMFGLLVIPAPVFVALGGDTNSVQADQIHMQGSLRSTRAQNYTVHDIQATTGTTVREYISPSGTVFAVAWKGPWPPDMRQLLGEYFDQYAQAAEVQSNARTGRRPLYIELPGLGVHVGVHPRSFVGTDYLQDRRPHGCSAE